MGQFSTGSLTLPFLQPSSVEPPAVLLLAALPAQGCWCGTRYSVKDLKSRPDHDFHLQWFLVHNPQGQTKRSMSRWILGVLRACCQGQQACRLLFMVLQGPLYSTLTQIMLHFGFNVLFLNFHLFCCITLWQRFFEELSLNLTEVFN